MKWTWLDIQQPGEFLDHTVEVDTRGEAIESIVVTPSSNKLTTSNDSFSGNNVTFWAEDGTPGEIYEISILATTISGRKFKHTAVLPVGGMLSEPAVLDHLQICYRVRRFMRDTAAKNTLNMGQEDFGPEEYGMAVSNALALWNGTPPISSVTVETLTLLERRVIYMDAAAYLFLMAVNSQARNQIDYQDQGFSVQENNKAGLYANISASLSNMADLERRRIKTGTNMESMWSGTHHDTYDQFAGGFNFDGETY